MKKYLAEGIGAFFLALVVVLTAHNGATQLAPLAVGLTLAGMMHASLHISGAHFNPALTLAMLIRRKIDRTDALYYIVAQGGGAFVAALFGVFFLNCGEATTIAKHMNGNGLCSLIAEFIGAFALAYVYLNVATTSRDESISHRGLAVSSTVAGAAWALGGISGGVFNPAVAIGATIAGVFDYGDLLIYLIGALLGAAAAASVVQVMER